jgi:glutamate-1-semialdehyde aminotransferase
VQLGPNLLGHHHPEVEAAAARQSALGDCLNGPTALFVELAEALLARIFVPAVTALLYVPRRTTPRRRRA